MTDFIFDDIGSYPLPNGVSKEWIQKAYLQQVEQEKFFSGVKLFKIINDAFNQKINAGVEAPTYPQYQDMNEQFLSIIRNPQCTEEPFKVKKSKANIVEIEAIDLAAELSQNSEKQNMRLCITGPIEMYLKDFGGTNYTDILNIFAHDVDQFISNAIETSKNLNINVISIDEPSIGINPQILFEDEDIIHALKIATQSAYKKGIDIQIHLHSPLHYKLALSTEQINIIGVEAAGHPSYLELIDRNFLEEMDAYLRVGLARTDISNLVSVLNEKYNMNVWKDSTKLNEIITELETSEVIHKRFVHAYEMFGDRIKYVGPDCGLGSWPSQEIAQQLLNNVSKSIQKFRQL